MRAEDLPKYLSIIFEGNDRTVVGRDAALKVGVQELRAAFSWLLFNNWLWMEATRHIPIKCDFSVLKSKDSCKPMLRIPHSGKFRLRSC